MQQQTLSVTTHQHQSMTSITAQVAETLHQMGAGDGIVHCYVQHTTCGVMINENADPDVATDLLNRLEKLVPWHDPADRHAEGNTAAHLRSLMVGTDVSVPVNAGRMQLGTWQGIFLCDFDGPRTRRVIVSFSPAA